MGRPRKPKLTKEQKWAEANSEFVSGLDGLNAADLNMKLSTLSKNMEETCESLKENLEPGKSLYEAKQEYTQLKAPFNDAKKLLKQKIHYVYKLLKERGN